MQLLYNSAIFSLVLQFITGGVEAFGLTYTLKDEDKILYIDLDFGSLLEFRKKFPAWMDADDFLLK